MLSEASRVRGAQLVLIGLGESPLGELQIDRTWKMEDLTEEAVE